MRSRTDYIFVHCSATKPNLDIGACEIREWHLRRGWKDIGYNYVIRRNGTVEGGRDLDQDGDFMEETGAHVRGLNSVSLGVCLVGGVDWVGRPDFNYTKEQMKSLEALIGQLKAEFPQAEVLGHRDKDRYKACPCFDVSSWWNGS
jgi:hypothetical protein